MKKTEIGVQFNGKTASRRRSTILTKITEGRKRVASTIKGLG